MAEDELARTRAAEHDGRSRPARDASTVLLVRDGEDGLEVLLQERHVATEFAGGALVFPGGSVDDDDAALPATAWRGVDPAAVGERLGTDGAGGLGLLVAAAREVFEEAGLLLAVDAGGRPVTDELLARPDVAEARSALAARDDGGDLVDLLERYDLRLDLGALRPFAWWVTPDGMHRRYDTRFFLAPAPPAQVATSDEVETTSARWLRPSAALAAGEEGTYAVIFPTRRTLEVLAGMRDVADAVAATSDGRVEVVRTEPRIVRQDGRALVTLDDGRPPEVP